MKECKSDAQCKENGILPSDLSVLGTYGELDKEYYDQLVSQYSSEKVNERSAYEEMEIVKNCTLFDIYRKPRIPITDVEEKRVLRVRDLNSNLSCPVCLGLIKHTMVVMECLHRFCGECIQKCLRLGMKECPSCRLHIPSKRSLRRDTNFDALIEKIYPDREQFEQEEANLIQEINRKRHFNNAFCTEVKKGTQAQSQVRNNRTKTSGDASPKREDAAMNQTSALPISEMEYSLARTDVDLKVLLHPNESKYSDKKLKKTLFRSSSRLKIRSLKQYLLGQLDISPQSPLYTKLKIVLPTENLRLCRFPKDSNGNKTTSNASQDATGNALLLDQELDDHFSLADIYEQYGRGTKWEMRLWYHFPDSKVDSGK